MTSVDEYREALERAANQEAYLLAHSGLPGPRGNLELARAAADVCSKPALRRWARLGADEAPTGTAEEFLAFCGVLGLGRALVEDDRRALDELRLHASDPRWRLREAVAMALQRWAKSTSRPSRRRWTSRRAAHRWSDELRRRRSASRRS
jgi:hypothetical protein